MAIYLQRIAAELRKHKRLFAVGAKLYLLKINMLAFNVALFLGEPSRGGISDMVRVKGLKLSVYPVCIILPPALVEDSIVANRGMA